ncbi:MAG: transcriptional repressor [Fibrobacteria bacterium]|nr:transcriptional repressor [Fibrobacteria bacterium]
MSNKPSSKTSATPSKPTDFEEALEKYREHLKRKRLLFTRERIAILEEVMARHDHFSVEELHDSLKAAGKKVSRATLYRNLDSLKEAGILAEVDLGNRHVQYEHVLGHGHHFHLVCEDDGAVVEDSSAEIEKLLEALARKHNLDLTHFKLQIFGTRRRK